MIIYLFLSIISVFFWFFFKRVRHGTGLYLFLMLTFLIVVFVFRGGFTSDYLHYKQHFEIFESFLGGTPPFFNNHFGQELGYVFINYITLNFTNQYLVMLFIYAVIIIIPPIFVFKKYSYSLGCSLLIFITVGPYYDSFNIMRQVMAVSISFIGFRYIVNRNFMKFTSIVVLAMFFHITAVFMFFMYFILSFRPTRYKLIILITSYALVYYLIDKLGILGMKYIYTGYNLDSYGVKGGSLNKLWMPVFISVIVFSLYTVANFKDNRFVTYNYYRNILLNSVLHYLCVSILATEFKMFERFGYYLLPYIALSIPYFIALINNKDERIIIYYFFVLVLIVYNYYTMSGTPYDPYFTIFLERK